MTSSACCSFATSALDMVSMSIVIPDCRKNSFSLFLSSASFLVLLNIFHNSFLAVFLASAERQLATTLLFCTFSITDICVCTSPKVAGPGKVSLLSIAAKAFKDASMFWRISGSKATISHSTAYVISSVEIRGRSSTSAEVK